MFIDSLGYAVITHAAIAVQSSHPNLLVLNVYRDQTRNSRTSVAIAAQKMDRPKRVVPFSGWRFVGAIAKVVSRDSYCREGRECYFKASQDTKYPGVPGDAQEAPLRFRVACREYFCLLQIYQLSLDSWVPV